MSNDVWVVNMPKLGETVTEGTIGEWFKQAGDTVALDDPLFSVSTDKVDSEIPSPYDGVVVEILAQAGDTVPIGTPVVRIGAPGTPIGASSPAEAPASAAAPSTSAPAAPAPAAPAAAAPAAASGATAAHEVTMPKLGETVTEGTVGRWLKEVGDAVAFDDPLYEVSTDKVDSEIPSPYDGILLEILVPAGETVPIGTTLARIGEPGAAAGPSGGGTAAPAAAAAATPAAPSGTPGATPPAPRADGGGPGALLSPVVRRLAAERGVDLGSLSGSGTGGRITRQDVEKAPAGGAAPAPAAPAATAAPAAAPAAAAAKPTAPAAASTDSRDQVSKLSRMRLLTADLMVKSLNTSAHVWTSVEVDFDRIDQVRKRFKDQFKKDTGASLTYLPFVARATCDALRAFPAVNSSIDIPNQTMTIHPYVNLGVAVDLDEAGLLVPVVKDADGLNIRGIATKITTMARAARDRKLGMPDLSGSTFTITNPGPFGSYASSPVINQPNVAILCTDGVKRRPVAVGDSIAIHSTGIIGLVYDHRAFDGSTASKFLLHLKTSLEERDWEAEVSA